MIIKTRGIVFKTIKYGETSMIVDIYTEEKGLRKFIVNGVRSKKAKTKASLLQVMSILDMVAFDREDKELNRIKEIKSAFIYQQIPFNIIKGAIGLFIAEVARKTIREKEENQVLFQYLFDTFTFLDQTDHSPSNLHISFLLGLSSFLGFIPGGDYSAETPYFDLKEGVFTNEMIGHPYFMDEHQSIVLYQFLQLPLEVCHQIALNRKERKRLLQGLIEYFQLHIDNFPTINAHLILQEVLS